MKQNNETQTGGTPEIPKIPCSNAATNNLMASETWSCVGNREEGLHLRIRTSWDHWAPNISTSSRLTFGWKRHEGRRTQVDRLKTLLSLLQATKCFTKGSRPANPTATPA